MPSSTYSSYSASLAISTRLGLFLYSTLFIQLLHRFHEADKLSTVTSWVVFQPLSGQLHHFCISRITLVIGIAQELPELGDRHDKFHFGGRARRDGTRHDRHFQQVAFLFVGLLVTQFHGQQFFAVREFGRGCGLLRRLIL